MGCFSYVLLLISDKLNSMIPLRRTICSMYFFISDGRASYKLRGLSRRQERTLSQENIARNNLTNLAVNQNNGRSTAPQSKWTNTNVISWQKSYGYILFKFVFSFISVIHLTNSLKKKYSPIQFCKFKLDKVNFVNFISYQHV